MSAKAILSASVSAPPVYVEDVFSTFLYTGTGGTRTITNGIDLSGKGGLVWIKNRGEVVQHSLFDTQRGINELLSSDLTNQQSNLSSSGLALNATSTGFAFGSDAQYYPLILNGSGKNFCSWTFREAPKFFDVVTYTGNGAGSIILSHNLKSRPGCIIIKRTDASGDWYVMHQGSGPNGYYSTTNGNPDFGTLNTTNAFQYLGATTTASYAYAASSNIDTVQIGLGTPNFVTNISGATYVAYLFASDAGGFGTAGTDSVVKCGTVVGSSNAEVYLGWEPQWILVKNADSVQDWWLVDNMRGLSSPPSAFRLNANLTNAETTGLGIGPTATGFQTLNLLSNSQNYIYIAIRRGPMKTPTVGTEVFSAKTVTATQATQQITGVGFSPDLVINGVRSNANYGQQVTDRLRGVTKQLFTEYTSSEGTTNGTALVSLDMDGLTLGSDSAGTGWNAYSGYTSIKWIFRRAPGFFDVVAYTGTGSVQNITHNLGVAPQIIINKSRSADANFGWPVYAEPLGNGQVVRLNSGGATGGSGGWDTTSPTATQFTVNGYNNNSVTYIAYLFATAPGVSKVGSYTGTGTTKQIDCGFTAGARFVLIKRTDSTGDWYVWDTARGIISGNDPYLQLNSAAAEDTSTDYIDPLSSGFEISSTAPAAINANGGTYIFLAIA